MNFHAEALAEVEQGSKEWFAARQQGIGGSDASAVLNMDLEGEYARTPLDIYINKKSDPKDFVDSENWFSRRGKALEPVLRQEYADKYGMEVRVPKHLLRHPQHKFMIASLDGYTDNGRIQEFKTATSYKGWGEEESDEIPHKYLIQVHHNLIVTGAEVADVSVSVMGLPPKYYTVEANKEIHEMIIDGESRFWEHVEKGVEPEPSSLKEMQQRYKIVAGNSVEATEEMLKACIMREKLRHQIKEMEDEKNQYEDTIKAFLLKKAADSLLDPHTKALVLTWNEQKGRTSLDQKRLKEERPEVFSEYSKVGDAYRVMRFK